MHPEQNDNGVNLLCAVIAWIAFDYLETRLSKMDNHEFLRSGQFWRAFAKMMIVALGAMFSYMPGFDAGVQAMISSAIVGIGSLVLAEVVVDRIQAKRS